MRTITFYSYKGGSGRSLALANAAVYLATLGFRVVALDFDLEAPGLHYKFSRSESGAPLAVERGLVDYVNLFIERGTVDSLDRYLLDVAIPGIDQPLVQLMPAGCVPSSEYWAKLAKINWHEMFYDRGAKGVQIFMELKTKILDELKPDFLLVDSRTGITEMGGVATTLFPDMVICMVLPTLETLHGARAVLRSLRRSRRELGGPELDIMLAVSRLPQMKSPEEESALTDSILSEINFPAADRDDTLACQSVFVLHSEPVLQIRESLRVGSGINPDESVLLRDYLRMFAMFVPKALIEPKVSGLVEKAWVRIRIDPDGAVKDMEALAESFGHPENYRELLRFYQVRNIGGTLALRRAQRLWELTGDSSDQILWQTISRAFDAEPRWRRQGQWAPNLEFIRSVWRHGGGREPRFGSLLAEAYSSEDRVSVAADVLLEVINTSDPTPVIIARCIYWLDASNRSDEAEKLIQKLKGKFSVTPEFAEAWAKHAIRTESDLSVSEFSKSASIEVLRPGLRAIFYFRAGLTDEAAALSDATLRDLEDRNFSSSELRQLSKYFDALGRREEFDKILSERYPPDLVHEIRRFSPRYRRR